MMMGFGRNSKINCVHKAMHSSCSATTSCFANYRTMLQDQQGKPDVSLQPQFTVTTLSGQRF